jgi:hypothetical protein
MVAGLCYRQRNQQEPLLSKRLVPAYGADGYVLSPTLSESAGFVDRADHTLEPPRRFKLRANDHDLPTHSCRVRHSVLLTVGPIAACPRAVGRVKRAEEQPPNGEDLRGTLQTRGSLHRWSITKSLSRRSQLQPRDPGGRSPSSGTR